MSNTAKKFNFGQKSDQIYNNSFLFSPKKLFL